MLAGIYWLSKSRKGRQEERIMYFVNSYFTVAIYLAVIAGILIAILRWHESIVANRRLQRMMVSCGIDKETAAKADQRLKLDMKVLQARCRHCTVTELCDSWLDGEGVASNRFCPNAWQLTTAAGSSRS
jgi:hypothetical protein